MADLAITASQVQPGSAGVAAGILGETLTAGQTVYKKASDGRIYKADANVTAAEALCEGILLHGGDAGQPARLALGNGTVTLGAGAAMTVGERYFVSSTPGGIQPSGDLITGEFVSLLGIAQTASVLLLRRHNSGVQVP